MTKLELHLTQALENIKALSLSTDESVADVIHMAASDALFRAKDLVISEELAVKATSLSQYIHEHRAELEAVLGEFHQETNFSNENLELWIMNDQGLYSAALSAGVEGI